MLAVILAAGKGLRMLELTKERPKAMLEIFEKPILEHILLSLRKAGFKKSIIVVGYKKEQIVDYFGNNFEGIKIKYVEQEKQLGTAHALKVAEKLIKERFLLCYSDLIAKADVYARVFSHANCAAIHFEKNAERFGVTKLYKGKIVEIVEKPKGARNKYVLTGIFSFENEIFEALKYVKKNKERDEYELTDALKILAKKRKLNAEKIRKSEFISLGTFEEYEKAKLKPEFFRRL